MALIRQCDICGCEIDASNSSAITNGYYRCTKVTNLFDYNPSKEEKKEIEGVYIIRERDACGDVIDEPIDICESCFKEMVDFKRKGT